MKSEYQIEREAANAKFTTFVKVVAKALHTLTGSATYTPGTNPEYVQDGITLAGGLSISFGKYYGHPRAEVRGNWPRTTKGEIITPASYDKENKYTNISISTERDATAVAKDIARRFLPGYTAEYAKAVVRAQSSDKYANDTTETLTRAAKILGQGFSNNGSSRSHESKRLSLSLADGYGSVEASGTSVTIELRSLPRDAAERILALVATFNK